MEFFRPIKVLIAMILVLVIVVAEVYLLGSRKKQPEQQPRTFPNNVQTTPSTISQISLATSPPLTPDEKIITHDYSTNPTEKYTSPTGHVTFIYYEAGN